MERCDLLVLPLSRDGAKAYCSAQMQISALKLLKLVLLAFWPMVNILSAELAASGCAPAVSLSPSARGSLLRSALCGQDLGCNR